MPNFMDIIAAGYAQIADDAAFDPTGNVEWRFDLTADAWAGAADDFGIAGRYNGTGDNRQWRIRIENFDDAIEYDLGDGTGAFRLTDRIIIGSPPADGERLQIRVTLDADNGAGGTDVTLLTRQGTNIADLANNDNWTNEGSNTHAGVQAWKATAEPMTFGWAGAAGKQWDGGLLRFIYWTDLTQTTKVADIDFTKVDNIAAAATNDDEWVDAVSANNWLMQGTHETDWDYIREGANDLMLLGVGR